ncbi:cupredoxin domain-containing protein [Natronobiforma cellulositropha]|uniref:cupredoxin domain-containing protein n=1 Tax=Natronobiforma cellulositropha TaxID=1679076 RepID=UPI0021D57996|nr:plastocyanin/azurin family copper-binding protein [Natronobiforma cellulositropha]
MRRDGPLSRRTMLALATGATVTALAGCTSDGNGSSGDTVDPDEWDDVDTIVLEGSRQHWVGVSPAAIEDESNPTLGLVAGRTYELTWENVDGQAHNLEIRDGSGTILEETDYVNDEGETTSVTFEATEEMDTYVCAPHPGSMVGAIDVFTE